MPYGQSLGGRLCSTKPMVSGMNVPEDTPSTNSAASSVERFGANGVSADASVKRLAEIISTRRGPNTRPSHAETGPMLIWPTVVAVVIQAPSS